MVSESNGRGTSRKSSAEKKSRPTPGSHRLQRKLRLRLSGHNAEWVTVDRSNWLLVGVGYELKLQSKTATHTEWVGIIRERCIASLQLREMSYSANTSPNVTRYHIWTSILFCILFIYFNQIPYLKKRHATGAEPKVYDNETKKSIKTVEATWMTSYLFYAYCQHG